MANKPLDVANGKDPRNHWKVVLFKTGEGEIQHTALFYPTKEKAQEIADYINSRLTGTLKYSQQYIVKPHNPDTYVSCKQQLRISLLGVPHELNNQLKLHLTTYLRL